MTISYIIPLYNGAEFIETCLNSIVNQDVTPIDQFEVIVINDGSTDNSPVIVDEFSKKHQTVRLINQSNQGVGAARNKGVEEANGEYIFFVDADDSLINGGMSKILGKAFQTNKDFDVIKFDRHFVLQRNSKNIPSSMSCNIYFHGKVKDFVLRHGIVPFVTSYIFKRDFIKDYEFNKFKIGEDLCFMMTLFDKTDAKIIAFDSKLYLYNCWNGSTVHRMTREGTNFFVNNYMDIYKSVNEGLFLSQYSHDERKKITVSLINYFTLTRILATPYGLKELNTLMDKCKDTKIFDFYGFNGKLYGTLRFLAKHGHLMWFASQLYRLIYIPYFKKG